MSKFSRAEFNDMHNFFATRSFTFAGVDYVQNDPFPKDGKKEDVDPRRLRQMYDTRQLRSELPKVEADAPVRRRLRRDTASLITT